MIGRFVCAALLLSPLVCAAQRQQPFTLTEAAGVDWFQDSRGNLFFSNGVDVVDEKTARKQLQSWGFNTIGAWSDPAFKNGSLPFTVELHLGSSQGFPWCDFMSDRFALGIRDAAETAARQYRANRQLLGYFSDNELGWWGPSIFLYQLRQPPESATRRKLFATLREHYRGSFKALEKDFEVRGARDWQQLEAQRPPQLFIRPGHDATGAIEAFTGVAAERYYSVTAGGLRAADNGHLLLGDRYAGYWEMPIFRLLHAIWMSFPRTMARNSTTGR